MRITLIADPGLVNSNYRAYQPMQELSRLGHEIRYTKLGESVFHPSLADSDVVLIHRYCQPEVFGVVQRLHAAGIGIVWDNDDDLTAVPKWHPGYRTFGGANRQHVVAALRRIVRLADVVTTPSATLARQYRAAGGADVRLLENFLPREFRGMPRREHEGIVVAWLAGLEHQTDYDRLRLRATLLTLLEEHTNLRVMSIGLGLGLPPERYEHQKLVPFLDLASRLAKADIGLAPLADIPWNRARSNIKLKEYGAAGLAWLASPVGPYLELGEEQGGRLVNDKEWDAALHTLITSVRERRTLGEHAWAWAQGETIDRHATMWLRACKTAAERGAKRRRSAA